MRRWFPIVFILASLGFSLAVYSRLPDPMPLHWGIDGRPDRFGSKLQGAFFAPAIMIALLAFMQWIPSRDPRAANIAKFRDTYDVIVGAMMAFLTVVHVVALGTSLGWDLNMSTTVLASVGILFVQLGNLLPRARSNFVLGIRTPWTLSSDAVWTRVHRVGGYAMVAAGLITVVAAFLQPTLSFAIALPSLLIAALVPLVYSYVLYMREQRDPPTG